MAFAAAIGPMISGVASLAGAAASSSAMNAQADAEEQIANWNADRYREKAAYAQSKGAVESYKIKQQAELKRGTARAVTAQSGLSTTRGSPLLIDQRFAAEQMYEENMAMAEAQIEQGDLLNREAVTRYEGGIRAAGTRSQARATLLSGVGGAVSGFAKAFG